MAAPASGVDLLACATRTINALAGHDRERATEHFMTHVSRPFKIKHTTLPLFVIHATTLDLPQFEQHLQAHLAQDPGFFAGSPVALSLDSIVDSDAAPDFAGVAALLKRHDVALAGVVGGSDEQRNAALLAGLALFQNSPAVQSRPDLPTSPAEEDRADRPAADDVSEPVAVEPIPADVPSAGKAEPQPSTRRYLTRVVDRPIRAGQRVQSDGGDLVVLAAVNPGAELIADGNIHVYAALRGRALAGARGDEAARIFVQQLEAELVSIAGYFRVFVDGIPEQLRGVPVQIYLDGTELRVERL
jgi:septum site-determining protein MinC